MVSPTNKHKKKIVDDPTPWPRRHSGPKLRILHRILLCCHSLFVQMYAEQFTVDVRLMRQQGRDGKWRNIDRVSTGTSYTELQRKIEELKHGEPRSEAERERMEHAVLRDFIKRTEVKAERERQKAVDGAVHRVLGLAQVPAPVWGPHVCAAAPGRLLDLELRSCF